MQEQGRAPLTLPAPPAARRAATAPLLLWAVLLVSVALDQGSKIWALRSLAPGEERPVFGELISLRLIRNPGAAFSVLDGMTYAVTAVAAVIVVRILWLAHTRLASRAYAWVLGLVAGGAIGNLIDRFFREPGVGRGHVVDFIDYFGMFVGNVADVLIVLAAIAFALLVLGGRHLNGSRGS